MLKKAASSSSAPNRNSTAAKKMMATTAPAKKMMTNPLFAPGAEVEVRSRFTQAAIISSASGAERQVVIYARATVVSASLGTASYLVRYPAAAGFLPSRVARVPASDVREPRRCPTTAVDAAPARPTPSGSKRPAPTTEQQPDQHGGGDGRGKKAKRAPRGRGIPMDALLRFFEEHEREQEEAAKKKRKRKAELAGKPLQKQDAPVFFLSVLS